MCEDLNRLIQKNPTWKKKQKDKEDRTAAFQLLSTGLDPIVASEYSKHGNDVALGYETPAQALAAAQGQVQKDKNNLAEIAKRIQANQGFRQERYDTMDAAARQKKIDALEREVLVLSDPKAVRSLQVAGKAMTPELANVIRRKNMADIQRLKAMQPSGGVVDSGADQSIQEPNEGDTAVMADGRGITFNGTDWIYDDTGDVAE